ncbi:MAG: RidA family protein [Mogibacterium sp.]|nr:RidA family protein [Mogibacterium sp.]
MKREIIQLSEANSVAPVSPAVRVGDLIFVSGQVGFDNHNGCYYGDDIVTQTRGAFENLREVLEAAGSDLEHLVKVSIYLKDVNDFPTVNGVYKEFIGEPYPARICYGIADIFMGGLIEIEAIAVVKD